MLCYELFIVHAVLVKQYSWTLIILTEEAAALLE